MLSPEFLPWDSEFFGCRIARLDGTRDDAESLPRALAWCRDNAIDCVYYLLPASDTAAVREAEDAGLHLMDIRLTLERCLSSPPSTGVADMRIVTDDDISGLRAIAGQSHTDSRFYADRGFARDRCDELYRTWIEKSCRSEATRVFTEGPMGRPAGYITCERDGTAGSIGLIAVAPDRQGDGVGTRLVDAALGWFADNGVQRVTVVTQGRNVKAQRLYQGAGFRSCSVELWYHAWVQRPAMDWR